MRRGGKLAYIAVNKQDREIHLVVYFLLPTDRSHRDRPSQ
jgi:hypothetical protein